MSVYNKIFDGRSFAPRKRIRGIKPRPWLSSVHRQTVESGSEHHRQRLASMEGQVIRYRNGGDECQAWKLLSDLTCVVSAPVWPKWRQPKSPHEHWNVSARCQRLEFVGARDSEEAKVGQITGSASRRAFLGRARLRSRTLTTPNALCAC